MRLAFSPDLRRAPVTISRRNVLRSSATIVAGGAIAVGLRKAAGAAPPDVPDSMRSLGQPVLSHPYGVPSKFEKDVVRRLREPRATDTESFSVTPLQNLHGIITPNGLVISSLFMGLLTDRLSFRSTISYGSGRSRESTSWNAPVTAQPNGGSPGITQSSAHTA